MPSAHSWTITKMMYWKCSHTSFLSRKHCVSGINLHKWTTQCLVFEHSLPKCRINVWCLSRAENGKKVRLSFNLNQMLKQKQYETTACSNIRKVGNKASRNIKLIFKWGVISTEESGVRSNPSPPKPTKILVCVLKEKKQIKYFWRG